MKRSFVLLALLLASTSLADTRFPLPGEFDDRINRGLNYLAQQQKADGSFDAETSPVACTGLSLLAFLSCGHTPDVGKYGLNVRSALDYLVDLKPKKGYYADAHLVGHCIVTAALAQSYGTEADAQERKNVSAALDSAVKVLLGAQQSTGGFGAEPDSTDANLPSTVAAIYALTCAKDAGIEVPSAVLQQAQAYILRCYHPDAKSFSSQPTSGPSPTMTAAAVLGLSLIDPATNPILGPKPNPDQAPNFYLATFCMTESAAIKADTNFPGVWHIAWDQLVRRQAPEGFWRPSQDEPGKGPNGREKGTLSMPPHWPF